MDTKNVNVMDIPVEKFQPATGRDVARDRKFDTKPVSAFKDAWLRFCKNKGSVVAFIIIIMLVLFAIIVPIVSPYTVSYSDMNYAYMYPRNELCVKWGWDFWDGCVEKTGMDEANFLEQTANGLETGKLVVKNNKFTVTKDVRGYRYSYRQNTYYLNGRVSVKLSLAEFESLQEYQDEHGVQLIYPAVAYHKDWEKDNAPFLADANRWYKMIKIPTRNADGTLSKTKKKLVPDVYQKDEKGKIIYDENGYPIIRYTEDGIVDFEHDYRAFTPGTDPKTGKPWDGYSSKMLVEANQLQEGEERLYNYAVKLDGDLYQVRVDYYEYYGYLHTEILKDGISKPSFLFGTTQQGKDIFTCLGSGARLSFLLAIAVSTVNMLVGAIYGSIEGYYGGKLDLIMERFSDILSAVPFMIVITLLKMHMGTTPHLLLLFISFFLTGWIGMASRVRMQFYRFKNQEYVLAARTLGARDARVMLRHIFPNSLGTIITGSVLSIPGVIFSESSLSYLGIINLNTGSMTSVGNMLSNAGGLLLQTHPYMMFFPAIFICLLMLSFNLLGNGLRDAFNPSLRGSED